ncbi:unnamed protein product [Vitrella brassicaformis CCMP3155]|uniref:SD-repeat containing protein B domain-containing protein n=1 Tax=Vitrella brassicaformis (strain CCMP3155) TaxID=1169540 RepID=A0A0G4ECE7_VITBC|nr:unnamed protein product [Vitrella brassicaformis CCMP3155]|eukprot:CEL93189.1 unnamed protein product [Vitrella brassicaformis CCMP3155]
MSPASCNGGQPLFESGPLDSAAAVPREGEAWIVGAVFLDTNSNGLWEESESAVNSYSVNIIRETSMEVVDTVVPHPNGTYSYRLPVLNRESGVVPAQVHRGDVPVLSVEFVVPRYPNFTVQRDGGEGGPKVHGTNAVDPSTGLADFRMMPQGSARVVTAGVLDNPNVDEGDQLQTGNTSRPSDDLFSVKCPETVALLLSGKSITNSQPMFPGTDWVHVDETVTDVKVTGFKLCALGDADCKEPLIFYVDSMDRRLSFTEADDVSPSYLTLTCEADKLGLVETNFRFYLTAEVTNINGSTDPYAGNIVCTLITNCQTADWPTESPPSSTPSPPLRSPPLPSDLQSDPDPRPMPRISVECPADLTVYGSAGGERRRPFAPYSAFLHIEPDPLICGFFDPGIDMCNDTWCLEPRTEEFPLHINDDRSLFLKATHGLGDSPALVLQCDTDADPSPVTTQLYFDVDYRIEFNALFYGSQLQMPIQCPVRTVCNPPVASSSSSNRQLTTESNATTIGGGFLGGGRDRGQ